ncbi:choice-of-anchor D domain-containing protein [Nitratireductor kimnyeongensis]|uniref:Choice-of-anchor D domain-containing protein n=1 Tax=Nitratireductor kimnyeongensis TaxID=430679 RepID=A0ABW0T4S3_9HYPH|nr:choice-of-anchor D domain-containing protein [Nitratireductor kimnyeongensis]QZZ35149.1 choice-of-anchor D domain-containing protein [Nitratireductor kimnyeongensis]
MSRDPLFKGAFRKIFGTCSDTLPSVVRGFAAAALAGAALMSGIQHANANWTNPSVSLSFNGQDGRCIAGPYANATTTEIVVDWTAYNTDAIPGRYLQLIVWDEGSANTRSTVPAYGNAPVGQMPTQRDIVEILDQFLITGTSNVYLGLRDNWDDGSVWSDARSPVNAADRVGPASGTRGYTFIDMASDPDCVAKPEIEITGNAQPITDGAASTSPTNWTHFGSTISASSYPISRVFGIRNVGTGTLTISSASLSGANASQFTITSPPPSSIAPGGSGTFTVRFSPVGAPGSRSATVTLRNNDADEDPFTFAISGTATNTAPTANAGSNQTVNSGAAVTMNGSASSTNDSGQTLSYSWSRVSGPAVSLSGASTATPSFTAPTLSPGASNATLVFQLTVNDGSQTATDTVTITVTPPPNTPPTANAGSDQTVTSGAAVSLNGSASSSNDAGQSLTYSWSQTSGPAVTLAGASTATPSFTSPTLAPGASNAILTFQLTVNDSMEAASDAVTITVTPPPNTPPTANAGSDATVTSSDPVSLDGSASSSNDGGQPLTYAWSQTSGPAVTLTNATTATPSFTAPALTPGAPDTLLVFELTVNDGVEGATDSVTITVQAPPNTPPTADAGTDQTVGSSASVSLDGTGSSANDSGQTLTYSWTQTGGASVSLSGGSTAAPSFIAPTLAIGDANEVLTFDLTVNDGVTGATDSVTVTVTAPGNTTPTADAGPDQTVASAASVTLDGTGSSDPDGGQTLTYAWTQTSGPAVTLTGASTASPSFTAPTLAIGDADAVLVFQLTVDDSIANASDSVSVTVRAPGNTPATADAGANQTVGSGTPVALDGSGSSTNDSGQTLTYAWTQTSGPAVTLSGAGTVAPTFTAPTLAIGDANAVLVFELSVDDGFSSDTDSVTITVTSPPNTPATADAGSDQTVASGASVSLDGSASSANDGGQALTYSWTQTSGQSVTLAGPTTASPSFVAPSLAIGAADEVLVFELSVNDGFSAAVDSVSVTVSAPGNTPPTANAGSDATVAAGASVSLDGAASSANDVGQSLTYSWVQTSGPAVALTNATNVSPSFTAPALAIGDADEVLVFELEVNDGFATATDSVNITVSAPGNTPPTADAGADQGVDSGTSVTLDGSGSSSNDAGQPLSYAWTQTGGPAVTLAGAGSPSPTFNAPTVATGDPDVILTFDLEVNDGFASATDQVEITVSALGDITRPTVSVSGPGTEVVMGETVVVEIIFSEPVFGFSGADISVLNGHVRSLTGAATVYHATIVASGQGDLTVSVPSGVASDAAGNTNLASGTIVVSDASVRETQQQMARFMQARATQLISGQPDLIALYRGNGSASLNAQATSEDGNLTFATRPTDPIWAELSASWSKDTGTTNRYVHLSTGTHFELSQYLAAGAMVQVDHLAHENADASISGTGWLAGPYLVGRLPGHPLYFSAQALLGQSRNSHAPFGTYTDTVRTQRGLFRVTVAGDVSLGLITLTPSLDAVHLFDRQRSYTDSLGNEIPEQSITMNSLELSLDASIPINVPVGALTLRGGVPLTFSSTSGTGEAASVASATDGARLGFRVGLDYWFENGGKLALDFDYDGLGSGDYEKYGAGLKYRIEF